LEEPNGTPKNHQPRKRPIPMTSRLWWELKAYRDWPGRPRPLDPNCQNVLINGEGKLIWNDSDEWTWWMKQAGLVTPTGKVKVIKNRGKEYRYPVYRPKFTFHVCRHYFASDLLRRGAQIELVSELLGHSSYLITQEMYIHLVGGHKAAIQAVRDLDRALGVPLLGAPEHITVPASAASVSLPAPVHADDRADARARLAAGGTVPEIMTAKGVHQRCMMDWLRDDLVELTCTMRAGGAQIRDIIARTGLTTATVYALLHQGGHPVADVPWRRDDGTPRFNGRRSQSVHFRD
jgi:hypothetical protein